MRLKHLMIAGSISLALAATGSASAFVLNNQSQFGLSVLGGLYNTAKSRNSNNSGFLGVRPFYQFNRYFNLGLLLGLQGTEKKTDGDGENVGFAVMPEAQVQMPILGHLRLIPHLTFGLGMTKVADDTRLSMDAGAGLSYYFTQRFSVSGDYRAFHQFNQNKTDQLVTLGVDWHYGGAHPMPTETVKQPALTAEQQSMLHNAQNTLRYLLPNGVHRCDGSNRDLYSGCVSFDGNKMVMHLYTQFKINSASVENNYIKDIDRLVAFMKQHKSIDVELRGYSSVYSGTKQYNQWLSQKRADAVKNYMMQHGIAADRLTANGFGATENNQLHAPIHYNFTASQQTEWERKMSRRVQAEAVVPAKLINK